MTGRMEQAREAALQTLHDPDCALGMSTWDRSALDIHEQNACTCDRDERIALRASEMERDRIVAWLRDRVKNTALWAQKDVLTRAADALARGAHHQENDDANT